MLMTASFGIGSFVMLLAENLAGPLAVTVQITASISDGLRCYFASPLQKVEGLCGLRQAPWLFSADYQPDQPGLALRSGRLDSVALSRYWSGIVVDLSRPACGHVKEALKGREFWKEPWPARDRGFLLPGPARPYIGEASR
jgi:hypothetical protein